MDQWLDTLPVFNKFAQVAELSRYARVPDSWIIGVSDVVRSTAAIQAGRYKAVNLAGAGTISAVANELDGNLELFIFGGDGARFIVSPEQATRTANALSRVAMWAKRDLDLDLRVGMISVAEARAAGVDVRAAFWQASTDVRYAMFTGGGLEWADAKLKAGKINLAPADTNSDPDLTGLSCQWGPVQPRQGKIVSLIVKPAPKVSQESFIQTVSLVIKVLEETENLNPVPLDGPDVRWPSAAIWLQSRIAHFGHTLWRRRLYVLTTAALTWLVFKLGIRIGQFEPKRYRREITANTDFRKFDDGLMMTVDCTPEVAETLQNLLKSAATDGTIRYGMHMQDEALMTCVVPSVATSDHMHFIDGAGGGYAAAAEQLRQ